jgi:hypothetical protein
LADITYYEDDYIATGYHVYTADAVIALQPYLVENYIIRDYFESRGVESLLVADLTRSEFIEFAAALNAVGTIVILAGRLESATVAMTCTASMSTVAQASLVASSNLTSNFTQTTTANRDRRTSVTLSTIADLASQSVRLRDYQMQANGQFAITAVATKITDSTNTFSSTSTAVISADRTRNITQNITAEATLQATATPIRRFTSTFASIATQLTVAFQNATGTILMEPTATLSALVGVIKQARISSPIGVDANSEPDSTASPFLRFGSSSSATPLDGFVSVSNSVNQTGKFVMSMWMVKPIGYVFDADPNRDWYSPSPTPQLNNNSIQVETLSGAPYFYYRGNTGYVVWPLGPSPRLETLANYSHYLLSVDITKSTNAEKYRLFKDGVEITGGVVHQLAGVGAGQSDTVITTPFDLKITAFDQYQLLMNTTGAPLHPDPRDGQGGGYGDSNGVKDDRSGLTQFWWDYDAASYDIDNAAYRAKFYDGNYRDLGDQGTATGLSRPKHYVRLLDYQDIEEQGTKRSVQGRWNWQKLQVDSSEGTNPVIDFLIAENYTATLDQNSSNVLLGIRSAFSLVANSVTVLEVTSVPQAVFTLSAIIGRRQNFTASLAAQAQLTVNATVNASAVIGLNAAASLTANYTRTRSLSSALSTASTLSATPIKIRQLAAALTASTQLSADVGETTQMAAVMISTATVAASVIRVRNHTATLTAQAQLAASIDNRLRDQSATLTSMATVICLAQTLEGVDSLMASQFAITVNTEIVKVAQASLTGRFTQSTQGIKAVSGSATLQVNGFTLTQGDVINFAPELILYVPQETRTRQVLLESRVYDIDSESRTRRVLEETRVLSIEQETEVNII